MTPQVARLHTSAAPLAGPPVSLVRASPPTPARDTTPLIVLGAGIALGALLIFAAVMVRRRTRRPGTPREERRVQGAFPTLARAMRLGRTERRALERLASVAGVREPAVLLLSESAFSGAVARVVADTPEARAELEALAEAIGFGRAAVPALARVRGETGVPARLA